MKKRFAIFALTSSLFAAASFSAVYAASAVQVVYNGQAITYGDVQPQIINDRTMVPIRDTADFFGMTVGWDAANNLMTLTKGDKTILHTLNTNYLIVNGTVTNFDTPSQVINDRNVMPVRMLAEAIGANVEWDGQAQTVTITDNAPTVVAPSVLTAVPNSTVVNVGETVNVTVTTSSNTWGVRLVDGAGTTLATSTDYNDTFGVRSFVLSYTPLTETLIASRLTVQPSDGTMYYTENSQYFSLSVKAGIKILRFSIDKSNVKINDTVTLTVVTDENATNVRVTNNIDNTVMEKSIYSSQDGSRTFEMTYKASTSGRITFSVSAGTDYAQLEGTETVSLSVDEAPRLSIWSMTPAYDTVTIDSQTAVTVRTNDAVTEVVFKNANGDTLSTATQYTTESGGTARIFRLYATAKNEGTNTVYVYAYDSSRDYVEDSFRIYGTRNSGSGLTTNEKVLHYYTDTSNRQNYGTVEITVETSLDIYGVYIYDRYQSLSAMLSVDSTTDTYKVWKGTVSTPTSETYTYYLYYDDFYNVRNSITLTL